MRHDPNSSVDETESMKHVEFYKNKIDSRLVKLCDL